MKPIVALDIETTGTDKTNDWIVQFAAIKVNRETNKIIDKINLYIKPASPSYKMGIGAYLKHGIHPDILADKPTFKEVAPQILAFISGCDLLTHNGNSFDLPFLMNEFARSGFKFSPSEFTTYDSYREEARRHSNKLTDAFTRYCGRTMEEAGLKAHDAFSDVKACYAVFRHQNETAEVKPEEIFVDDNALYEDEFNGSKEVFFSFGRYRDVPVKLIIQTDRSYINWFLNSGVCDKTKKIVYDLLNGEG